LNAWTQSALCKITLEMDVVVFFPEFADQEGAQGREG